MSAELGKTPAIPSKEGVAGMESLGPEQFLRYLSTSVSVDAFSQDRHGQATLARIMDRNFSRDKEHIGAVKETGRVMLPNPYPVLELKKDQGTYFKHGAFKLQDPDHYYYFSSGNPMTQVPQYLRREDVVPSGTYAELFPPEKYQAALKDLGITERQFAQMRYDRDPRLNRYRELKDIPFNKSLDRVPIKGGNAQRFDCVQQKWVESGEGIYKPLAKEKMKNIVKELFPTRKIRETLAIKKSSKKTPRKGIGA